MSKSYKDLTFQIHEVSPYLAQRMFWSDTGTEFLHPEFKKAMYKTIMDAALTKETK